MAIVELKEIRKKYGAIDVIHGVDLTIDHGEFCVFVGPSGCGKSTLLRMIAGLEEITSGDMLIDGQSMAHVDPAQRGVAMVFQNYALYPHMSVRDNMEFGLKMTKRPKVEIAERVGAAAKILQLDHLMERKPGQLSGGQRQRVAIGRAIVRNPKVFLFDEPLSNLDAELRVAMRVEIAKLHQELGNTMIYVTHDQTEAMTLADKIVVLRGGKIEQVGAPLELYHNPVNQFVAGFIGSPKMNFLNTSMRDRQLHFGGQSIAAPTALRAFDHASGLKIGIRPEQFGVGAADVVLRVTIDVVEHLGGTAFLYAKAETGEALVIERRSGDIVRAGDVIQVGFALGDARFFAEDGARVYL